MVSKVAGHIPSGHKWWCVHQHVCPRGEWICIGWTHVGRVQIQIYICVCVYNIYICCIYVCPVYIYTHTCMSIYPMCVCYIYACCVYIYIHILYVCIYILCICIPCLCIICILYTLHIEYTLHIINTYISYIYVGYAHVWGGDMCMRCMYIRMFV